MVEQGASRSLFKGEPEDLPVAALEKNWEAADDVILCMDATTGQTLWRTRIEGVGYNRQHHKQGPYNQTVAVHDGRVFAIGSGGWLYAMDMQSGEMIWHQKVGGEHTHQSHAVLAVDEAVIIPEHGRWAAFDPATGKRLWRNEALPLANVALPAFWRAENGTPVIFVYANGAGSGVAALDARTGKELFVVDLPPEEGFKQVQFARGSERAGNPSNMTVFGNALITHEALDDGHYGLAVYDLSLDGMTKRWRWVTDAGIRGEWSPLVVAGRWVVTSPTPLGILTFDLKSGKLISEGKGANPGNNGLLMVMEDLIIAQEDMTHGNIDITIYKVDDQGRVRNLNPDHAWPLAVPGTGSYHHPIMQAVADGRIFIRLSDGIYAYDLRKQKD